MRGPQFWLGVSLLILFIVLFIFVYFKISQPIDSSLFIVINEKMNVPSLNFFFEWLSLYGREYFWIPVVALIWILGGKDSKKAALLMVIVFIIIIIVGLSLKAIYYRPRPFLSISSAIVLLPKPMDSSFPSGHALIVIGGATVALLLLKKRYSIPLLIEALLVSYSRIYVGLHYPFDVLGGGLLGAAIALITYSLLYDTRLFNRLFEYIEKIYGFIIRRPV